MSAATPDRDRLDHPGRSGAGARGWRPAGAALALLVALVAVVVAAGRADAHAVLVDSSPRDGQRVAESPSEVRLRFDESVVLVPGRTQVIDRQGGRVSRGAATVSGQVVTIPLAKDLPRGTYTAMWRVVSADGHVVVGSVTFGVREDPTLTDSTRPDASKGPEIGDDVGLGLVYLGVVLGTGVVAAERLVPWTRRTPAEAPPALAPGGLVASGWLLMLAGTIVQLLTRAAIDDGTGLGSVVRFDGLDTTVRSPAGGLLVMRAGLVLLGLAASLGRRRRAAALIPGGIVVVMLASSGHGATGGDSWFAVPVSALHIAAMAFWIGGLVIVCWLTRESGPDSLPTVAADGLHRWSRLAFVAVAVLVVTGEYQAWRQVQPVDALWSTRYGWILLAKLTLVATALGFGWAAQRRVRRLPSAGPADGSRALVRGVRVEALTGVAIIGVTAALVAQAPARTTYGPGYDKRIVTGADVVHVEVSPTRRGRQQISVGAVDRNGTAIAIKGLSASLSSSDAGITSLPVRFDDVDVAGSWRATVVTPLPGVWQLSIEVEYSQDDAYAVETTYRVW